MKVSTKGRYALRLMICLAEHDQESYIPLKEVATHQGISVKYLEQIVIQLNAAGYLKSCRGPQGGYKLAKAPKDYTVGSILRMTEGNLAPTECLTDTHNTCPRYSSCTTIHFWEGLYSTIDQYIDSFTLQDLVDQDRDRKKEA